MVNPVWVGLALFARISVEYVLVDGCLQLLERLEIRVEHVDVPLLPQMEGNEAQLLPRLRLRIRLLGRLLALPIWILLLISYFALLGFRWHWHINHIVAGIIIRMQRSEGPCRRVALPDSVQNIETVLLATVDACDLGLRDVRRLLLDGLDHVLDPVDGRNIEARQRLRFQKVRLLVEEALPQFDLIFLVRHGSVHEVEVDAASLATRQDFELKVERRHLGCDLVSVPLVNVLLVEAQVVRFGRDVPERIEKSGQDEADGDQRAACVELDHKLLALDHRHRTALPSSRVAPKAIPSLYTERIELSDALETDAQHALFLD